LELFSILSTYNDARIAALEEHLDELRRQLDSATGERDGARQDLEAIVGERNELRKDLDAAKQELDAPRRHIDITMSPRGAIEATLDPVNAELNALRFSADFNLDRAVKAATEREFLQNDLKIVTSLLSAETNHRIAAEDTTEDTLLAMSSLVNRNVALRGRCRQLRRALSNTQHARDQLDSILATMEVKNFVAAIVRYSEEKFELGCLRDKSTQFKSMRNECRAKFTEAGLLHFRVVALQLEVERLKTSMEKLEFEVQPLAFTLCTH
jgi:chromosome segregation ATPase